ncbi:hypothetical protein [Kineococcus rubinsiae]|uniref:hypothetical protein n=1 Tax=Kineococcus rubinsiae TaxID=2609562 RepID=UPI0014316FCB|nr:hypothetical protein [Kineococcus rubinsiae]NIZ89802.1 hypothetical protein [Kineococcus rubinsiae]
MTSLAWALLALLVVCALAGYLSATAQRLDRLHHRVETSRAGLEVELTRRASAALELATSGELDPATSLILADAATASLDAPRTPAALRDATDADDAARWAAESGLSRALAVVLPAADGLGEAGGAPATGRVGDAAHRVALARRFHNDAVVQTRRLRAKRVVRWGRLAGHARLPETADFDDGASSYDS